MVDDTAFGGTANMTLLVADKTTNDIYSITGPFNPAFGYSAAQNDLGTTGFIGRFDAASSALPGLRRRVDADRHGTWEIQEAKPSSSECPNSRPGA